MDDGSEDIYIKKDKNRFFWLILFFFASLKSRFTSFSTLTVLQTQMIIMAQNQPCQFANIISHVSIPRVVHINTHTEYR